MSDTSFPATRARQRAANQDDPRLSQASDRARALEFYLGQTAEAGRGLLRMAENDRNHIALQESALGGGEFTAGLVVYAMPYANWYRVLLDSGQDCDACQLTETPVLPFAASPTSPLPPGSRVLAWRPRGAPYAVLLGCLPGIVHDGSRAHPDWIVQGGNGGCQREQYYRDLPKLLAGQAGLRDFSCGRPLDASCLGEWGRLGDLGGGLFLDPLMAFLRADESCGLFTYYLDRLLRLAGHNFDLRTSLGERIVRDDNGEGLDWTGSTPYPWEALGAYRFGTAVHRQTDDADVLHEKPYAAYEPLYDDQVPAYRLEEYRDYLGQGYLRQLSLPPYGADGVARASDATPRVGVFREQLALDGGWGVASAHSFFLAKVAFLPIPRRQLPPEDPTGDDLAVQADAEEPDEEQGYRFAGIHGTGPEHRVQDAPRPGTDLAAVRTAAGFRDWMAYAFNWKGLHAFHYHAKDFSTPESGSEVPGAVPYVPDLNSLAGQQFLSAPQATELPVDHRYNARYYKTVAGLFCTPEGELVFRSASGCELRSVAGTWQISAPGDILFQSGRSILHYAGDDLVLRARSSMDLSTAEHDVRIKAERHGEFLAGNSGTGRLLLESRGTGIDRAVNGVYGEDLADSGVVLKSAGELVAWAGELYLRSTVGDVVLDAAEGSGSVRLMGGSVLCDTAYGVRFVFPGGTEKQHVYTFTETSAAMPGSVQTGGGLLVARDGVTCRGDLQVLGAVSSEGSAEGHMQYIEPGSDVHDLLAEQLRDVRQGLSDAATAATRDYGLAVTERWYHEERSGHATVIQNTQFAPRTEGQMRTEDFRLPECYYQELARAAGGGRTWYEPVIVYQGVSLRPHPGQRAWAEYPTLLTAPAALHDPATGLDLPRGGGVYEEPDLAAWQAVVPNNNYPITVS